MGLKIGAGHLGVEKLKGIQFHVHSRTCQRSSTLTQGHSTLIGQQVVVILTSKVEKTEGGMNVTVVQNSE